MQTIDRIGTNMCVCNENKHSISLGCIEHEVNEIDNIIAEIGVLFKSRNVPEAEFQKMEDIARKIQTKYKQKHKALSEGFEMIRKGCSWLLNKNKEIENVLLENKSLEDEKACLEEKLDELEVTLEFKKKNAEEFISNKINIETNPIDVAEEEFKVSSILLEKRLENLNREIEEKNQQIKQKSNELFKIKERNFFIEQNIQKHVFHIDILKEIWTEEYYDKLSGIVVNI